MSVPWFRPARLLTERLEVRESQPRDAHRIASFLRVNEQFHRLWEPGRPAHFYLPRWQRRRLREIRGDRSVRQFMIVARRGVSSPDLPDSDDVVGLITYSNIVRGPFDSCFVGYRIDQSLSRRGLMSEALEATIDHMFTHERIHRIEANIMPANRASIALVEKLGFAHEGYSPCYLEIRGKWEDHVRYARLAGPCEGRP